MHMHISVDQTDADRRPLMSNPLCRTFVYIPLAYYLITWNVLLIQISCSDDIPGIVTIFRLNIATKVSHTLFHRSIKVNYSLSVKNKLVNRRIIYFTCNTYFETRCYTTALQNSWQTSKHRIHMHAFRESVLFVPPSSTCVHGRWWLRLGSARGVGRMLPSCSWRRTSAASALARTAHGIAGCHATSEEQSPA